MLRGGRIDRYVNRPGFVLLSADAHEAPGRAYGSYGSGAKFAPDDTAALGMKWKCFVHWGGYRHSRSLRIVGIYVKGLRTASGGFMQIPHGFSAT